MEPEDSGMSSLEPAIAGNSSAIASSETEIKVEVCLFKFFICEQSIFCSI